MNLIYGGCIYFMTNKNKTTLYLGVTSNLMKRVQEHKECVHPYSFTAKYNLEYLIYYENFSRIEEAILMEKQIKKWNRKKKEALINKLNPDWNDLWEKEVKFW
ncbi:MAG: GIY-YIG nuclease family protein [Bacteroidota bacterium]